MSPGRKVAAFLAALVLVAGLGAAVGAAVGPIDTGSDGTPADHDGTDHGATDAEASTDVAAPESPASGAAGDPLGTSSVQDGHRLVLDPGSDPAAGVRFRVLDPEGAPVVATEVVHERPLHLIVVGRDLTTYLHLHPEVDADGTWSVAWPDAAPAPGSYRVVADLTPEGGTPLVLGTDLTVPGTPPAPEPLSAPSSVAQVGPLEVELTGTPRVGSSELTFSVTADGAPVEVDPHLGARGHLVALRAADLAYSHVHPLDGAEGRGPIAFAADLPSAGTYRLFLDISVGGEVVTAAFTVEVPEPSPSSEPAPPSSAPVGPDGTTVPADAPSTTDHPHEGGDDHEH